MQGEPTGRKSQYDLRFQETKKRRGKGGAERAFKSLYLEKGHDKRRFNGSVEFMYMYTIVSRKKEAAPMHALFRVQEGHAVGNI